MIEFHSETDFLLENTRKFSDWLTRVIVSENTSLSTLSYIFCSDEYLWQLNQKYLSHDTYTDIITFDYSEGLTLSGDVYISVDRVKENARNLEIDFKEELLRVMVHGVLHLIGYKDKLPKDIVQMRKKENEKIEMFHVEQ